MDARRASTSSAVLGQSLLTAVGGKTAKSLADALDLHTVGDLLRHYPRRYADRGELTRIAALEVGDAATVLAEVRNNTVRPTRNRNVSLRTVTVTDGTRQLSVAFFSKGGFIGRDLAPGKRAMLSGKVTRFRTELQLTNASYELLEDLDEDVAADSAAAWARSRIVVYPLADKLTNRNLADAVALVLPMVDDVEDPLPIELRQRYGLLGWADALRKIHQPTSGADVAQARTRLAWDEAMVLQVALAQRRAQARNAPSTPRTARPGGLVDAFLARLPFDLTAGQQTVSAELRHDLAESVPMHRLLQGEVGSGKTVVALIAMLTVVDAGGQAALLAPTEVLAQQHQRSIAAMLGPLAEAGRLGGSDDATRVTLLTGSLSAGQRREAMLEAASGQAGIVVGTHALLEDKVQFADLGLVVIDEQHRFGVHQRDALRAKGVHPPHLLVMTATPIPRTVAMTVFGDLDESALTELPRGRSPIQTFLVPEASASYVARMWGRVRDEVAAGRQAYVVCARIGDGAVDDDPGDTGLLDEPEATVDDGSADQRRPAAAVLDVLPELVEGPLAGLRVSALHGRMTPADKDEVMTGFAQGRIDVLVATTVIEVGVDVPNATVMVVLDADRFGMSQLHQLRGRVGRGGAQGWCLLASAADPGGPAGRRLEAVASTLDGFELARLDLEARREGDVLGVSQSGRRKFLKMLELTRHEDLIRSARDEATAIVAADPSLAEHPALAEALAAALDPERSEYLAKA